MKKIMLPLAAALTVAIAFVACKKDAQEVPSKPPQTVQSAIPQEVLAQIKNLGFSTTGVHKMPDGYLVEGDILLTHEHLNSKPKTKVLKAGNEEQYRSTNTVLGMPRTIAVSVNPTLPAYVAQATQNAIKRFNALPLLIKFSWSGVAGGQIVVNSGALPAGVWASAGFPTAAGDPYNQVLVNVAQMNGCIIGNTLTSIMAHELGHCIGFHHTNIPPAGAIHIPGTPVAGGDPLSWMNSFIGCGVNRPFTANDINALNWLY